MQASCSNSAHHQVGCGRSQPVEEHRPGCRVCGLGCPYSPGGWAAIPIPKVQGCCPLGLSIGFKILVVSQPLRRLPPWDISVLATKFKRAIKMVAALRRRERPWNSLAPSQRRLPGLGVGSRLILPGKVAESSLIEQP